MPLGLLDVIAPYFFAGDRPTSSTGSNSPINLGGVYDDVVGLLKLREIDFTWDEDAVCVWGRAGFDDPGQGQHTTPHGEVFDWHDIEIRFRLTAARSESATVAAAVTALGSSDPLSAVISALSTTSGPSDAPSSTFKLDLVITAVTLHLPFARPAQLTADGLLVPDPDHHDVKLVLPKVLVTITQGSTVGSVDASLDSWGASGLDTEADLAEGTAIAQDPPYALVGNNNSLFGWGFRSAILDFSDEHTPPEILAVAGTGDDWKGIFLPEVRIFVAPSGIRGLAVDAGAKSLLIGIGPGGGVSGDFDVEVVNQVGAVDADVRFQSADNHTMRPHWGSTEDSGLRHGELITPPTGALIVDVHGGQAPYTVTFDGTAEANRSHAYGADHPLTQGQHVRIVVTDSGGDRPGKTWSADLLFHVQALASITGGSSGSSGTSGSSGSGGSSGTTAGDLHLSFTPELPTSRRVVLVSGSDQDHVGFAVTPASTADSTVTLRLDGSSVPLETGGHGEAVLAHEDTTAHSVTVSWSGQPVPREQALYFARDYPHPGQYGGYTQAEAWSDQHLMFRDPVPDGQQQGGQQVTSATLRVWAAHFDAGTSFAVDGEASHDSESSQTTHNVDLAERRIILGKAALGFADGTATYPTSDGSATYHTSTQTSGSLPQHRRATIRASADAPSANASFSGTLQRDSSTSGGSGGTGGQTGVPAHVETPPTGQVASPSWFRSIKVVVRLVQNIPVAFEISGVIRFGSLAAAQLQGVDASHQLDGSGAAAVPATLDHGLVRYDLTAEWDSGNGDFRVDLIVTGGDVGDAPTNWIAQTSPANASAPDQGRDFVGLLTALAPAIATASGSGGDPVQGVEALSIGTGVVVAITIADIVHTKSLTLWGFEILVERDGEGWQAALLIDVGVELWFDITFGSTTLLRLPPDKAMRVRYDAIGVRFGERDGQMVLAPAFDASRGYELSVPDASSIQMPSPLGEILHLLALRVARINPLQIEADIGMKADLGVVSIDRARVRLTLPEAEGEQVGVTLTALGASVSIPNVLQGSGSLAIDGNGFQGALDLALVSVGVRVAASLAVESLQDGDRHLTAVYATLEVDFPVAIPLASSGLGIYGFLGLFGMHYKRTESAPTGPDDNPALDWLASAPGGDVTSLTLWGPQADHWAFGVGIVLGTMEGGTILNLKGVLILELPGPELLLYVKANFLSKRPAEKSTTSGTITALVEIRTDEILIGIIVQYNNLAPLLKLRVPIGAFFSYGAPQNFHIDIGSYHAPATARVLDLFDATAFVEIHGDQIDDVDPLVQRLGGPLPGLAIAAGIHAAIVWGNKGSGLYLEVSADAIVGVSFSPFQFLGLFDLRGRLHLWIVGIEASAHLDITALAHDGHTNVSLAGDVCGEVDFLFFSVKGCVHVELGDSNPLADAPPLVSGLTLQARTSSPVHGTATADRPVGAALATADTDPDHPAHTAVAAGSVPVDAIPVLGMMTAPVLGSGWTTVGDPPAPAPLSQGTGWARRGQAEYLYTLTSVTLSPATPTPVHGVQSVFRTGNRIQGDDTTVQYALLDWSPDPLDHITLVGDDNDGRVDGGWGWVCVPVADPANVLWTFEPCPPGPNRAGWQVTGNAFPDAPGTRRSQPAPTTLSVREPWRTGVASIDPLLGIDPAYVDQLSVPDSSALGFAEFTDARALAAPYERALPNPDGGLDELQAEVERLREQADKAGLLDVLTVTAGAATRVRLLLNLSANLLKFGQLVVRPLGADDSPTGPDVAVTAAMLTAPVPTGWIDPSFTGAENAALAIAYAHTRAQLGWRIAVVDTDLPKDTVTLMLGVVNGTVEHKAFLVAPSYIVCAVELALVAEAERAVSDTTDADNAQTTIVTAMTSDPKTRALLAPGTTYTATVNYSWQGRHVGETNPVNNGTATQSFGFTTDATAPDTLEPWLLYTFPSQGEKFHFTADAPVVCFASDDIDQLAGGYGHTIYTHVVPARTDLVRSSAPLGPMATIDGVLLSTFEHTLQRLHAGTDKRPPSLPCIVTDPGPRHGKATVVAPLDRNCDYTLDLTYNETVTVPAGGSLGHSLVHRGFSTGSFATPSELAAAIATQALEHRSVTNSVTTFTALSDTPSDTDLDAAVAALGLGALAPPKDARLVLLWEQHSVVVDPAPLGGHLSGKSPLPFPSPHKPPAPTTVVRTVPVAVLIDAPEPMWRTRSAPVAHTDPSTGMSWWEIGAQDWLTVGQAPIGEPGGLNRVPLTRVVRNSAGTRLVCLLGTLPGGPVTPEVHLALDRVIDPSGLLDAPGVAVTHDTVLQLQVGRPPWEETS